MPRVAQNTLRHAEQIVTALKLLSTRIADSAGKSAEDEMDELLGGA